MRCQACGLVYANPLPIPADIAQHYGGAPEEYWHKNEYLAAGQDFSPQIAVFRDVWEPRGSAPPVALDVGAGLGHCMRALGAAGFDTYGIEPGEAFRRAAIEHGVSEDRLALATVESATYEPGTFDFVTFGAVLEHLADPAGIIERVKGWLAPGGLIHAEVPSSDWLTSRIVNRTYKLQGLDYVTNLSPMHPPYHLYEFTRRSFELHGAGAGYDVVFVRRMTGRDVFLPGPAPAWRWLMSRTGTEMQLEIWLRASGSASGTPRGL
jgi:SAM-dependent methyltransferase